MPVSYRMALISASTLACYLSSAQQAANAQTNLPPVVVDAPAPKRQAKKPASPAPAAPTAAVQPPVTPLQTLATQPSASAEAASAKLDVKNTTGSALNLTPREIPATVNIVSQKDIEERGARGFVETLRLVPGVVAGNNPGEVGTTVTRGFYKAVGFSIDGARVADPVFLGRDYGSFHFERLEVLKGPASVVSGTSGLAGSYNILTKQASTERNFSEAMVSYGSFGTLDTGLGVNAVLSKDAAIRSTFTYSRSNGYVNDTDFQKVGLTNSILLKPSDRLKVTAAIDYFKDNFSTAYYGTPLVNRSVARDPTDVVSSQNGLVLDRSMRYTNYNFNDGNMKSESVWLRGAADYKLSSNWSIKNEVSYYQADRLWRDADFYTYTAPSITRGTTYISHDHEFWSDKMVLSYDGVIGGMRNRFATGAEYMATTFGSTRRFGSTAGVDIANPDRGYYPDGVKGSRESADHTTRAVFAENALNLTPAWLVSTGIRHESIDLTRRSVSETSGVATTFGTDLSSTTWRIGSSYELFRGTSVFGQYAKAAIPISSALMITGLANTRFKLSTGTTAEVGVKSTMFGGMVTTTASLYQIDQDDIITRDPSNPTVSIQGGSQRSRGVEVETAISLSDQWKVSLSGTLIDAYFTNLYTSAGKSQIGNRPLNSVPYAWSALMTYRFSALPATVGVQVTGVGPFYTDNTNAYQARERTVLDAWVGFDVGKGTLRVRGRNLTDEFYAEWADYNATSLYIGAPRSFDVTYSIKY